MRLIILTCIIAISLCDTSTEAQQARTYFCQERGVIWNQNQPCNQDSPERQAVVNRISKARMEPKKPSFPTVRTPYDSSEVIIDELWQIKEFPSKYANATIVLENIWLRGELRKSPSELPIGQQYVAFLQNKDGDTLAIAFHDDWAFRLKTKLRPKHIYSVKKIRLVMERLESGVYPLVKSLHFGAEAMQPADALSEDFNQSPIISDGGSASAPATPLNEEGPQMPERPEIGPQWGGGNLPLVLQLLKGLLAQRKALMPQTGSQEVNEVEIPDKVNEEAFGQVEQIPQVWQVEANHPRRLP